MQDSIDQTKYVKYDTALVKDSFLEIQRAYTVNYCRCALRDETFSRGDYQELLKLSLMYLTDDNKFHICAPGNISHARFMAKAIYHLKLHILSAQLTFKHR